jgi:YVTN family beta-propeller protein
MFRNTSRISSRFNRLLPLAGLLAAGLYVPAAVGQSVQFPTYTVGQQADGSYVVSNGAVITPSGTQVDLGFQVRAKAIALNPTGNHTAAVLTLGASRAVEIVDTKNGVVLQNYIALGTDSSGSYTGISYTPNGKYLLFSQDSSYVAVAIVGPQGLLQDFVQVSVPIAAKNVTVPGFGTVQELTTVTCYPQSANGTTGSGAIPCGIPYGQGTSYPAGIAVSSDSKTAYVVLDTNDTLAKIDLTAKTPKQGAQIRVGNVPHSVILSPDGKTAYVSNEAGRIATAGDKYQLYSDGTPVVADPTIGYTNTGTVSVVDVATFKVTGSIATGLHPTGMALYGKYLLVANAYDDSISAIDTTTNLVAYTINLGLPIKVPNAKTPAYGAGPNSIAVDAKNNIAYVALYNANAVAVVNLVKGVASPVEGLIPVAYAPSSVVLDSTDSVLLVANDKGIGTRNTFGSAHGVEGYNTHQDNGTVSIVTVPDKTLAADTKQVSQNNHWDLTENIESASGGSKSTAPAVIPAHIGDPSPIKHVFLIIRENRTYDQILGDVAAGNGDSALAVFGAKDTPNAHALVKRFPLLDNFYNPSRQSADGHNWILQAFAPYADDIQSPDWVRDYPSNCGDAIAYSKTGNLFNLAAAKGLKMKIYGEYVEYDTFQLNGKAISEPSWSDFYNDTVAYESGKETQLKYYNTVVSHSPLSAVSKYMVTNYPQFDLGIPDQFRVDIWKQDFAKDVAAGTVPALSVLWISSDHTGGPPTSDAEQADNDLALGRYVDIISHSKVWGSSAIFVEEDDAQNGVDHVDGHRSPGYIVSPFVRQGGFTDSTYYSQVNMTRTIEQILGLTPMNQYDLVASPMKTLFIDGTPTTAELKPWTHVANQVPLNQGVTSSVTKATDSPTVQALRAGWAAKKAEVFAGKYQKPDSEDSDTVNHLNWYESTGFTRPYPGESTVRPASEFNNAAPTKADDDDDN